MAWESREETIFRVPSFGQAKVRLNSSPAHVSSIVATPGARASASISSSQVLPERGDPKIQTMRDSVAANPGRLRYLVRCQPAIRERRREPIFLELPMPS